MRLTDCQSIWTICNRQILHIASEVGLGFTYGMAYIFHFLFSKENDQNISNGNV